MELTRNWMKLYWAVDALPLRLIRRERLLRLILIQCNSSIILTLSDGLNHRRCDLWMCMEMMKAQERSKWIGELHITKIRFSWTEPASSWRTSVPVYSARINRAGKIFAFDLKWFDTSGSRINSATNKLAANLLSRAAWDFGKCFALARRTEFPNTIWINYLTSQNYPPTELLLHYTHWLTDSLCLRLCSREDGKEWFTSA